MRHAGRQAAGVGPPESDDVERLAEREKCRDEAPDVTPDAGGRRVERASVDADAQQVYLISIWRRRTGRFSASQVCRMRPSTLPLIAALLRMTSSMAYRWSVSWR